MTGLAVEIMIGVVTLFASWGGSAFIAGMRWGSINSSIQDQNQRLARIEGMFELKLKDER
jgi:hypothetical protein